MTWFHKLSIHMHKDTQSNFANDVKAITILSTVTFATQHFNSFLNYLVVKSYHYYDPPTLSYPNIILQDSITIHVTMISMILYNFSITLHYRKGHLFAQNFSITTLQITQEVAEKRHRSTFYIALSRFHISHSLTIKGVAWYPDRLTGPCECHSYLTRRV